MTTYSCDATSEVTSRFKTRIDWKISGRKDCDEPANIFPDSQLEGIGETILRPYGIAFSVSNFGEGFIKDLGQPDRKLFDCRVELISPIGSHKFLGENCNQ